MRLKKLLYRWAITQFELVNLLKHKGMQTPGKDDNSKYQAKPPNSLEVF